jgi:endogenous inhibitor of DNA gyrase (YacG/DUF329 family)
MKYRGAKQHIESKYPLQLFNVQCPSCQAEVKNFEIIEKRGNLGCVRCLKI